MRNQVFFKKNFPLTDETNRSFESINPNFELNMKIFEQTGFSPKTITNDDYQVIKSARFYKDNSNKKTSRKESIKPKDPHTEN